MAAIALHVLALLPACATALGHMPRSATSVKVGVMNKFGVTRYQDEPLKSPAPRDEFYAADPATSREAGEQFNGAADFVADINWGWHHPNGVYATIPVGAPLIDNAGNIYLGADDAIRKFSTTGQHLWSYAPRGQLAASPSLVEASPSSSRKGEKSTKTDAANADADYIEAMMMPDRLKEQVDSGEYKASPDFKDIAEVGDRVQVRPGMEFRKGEKEYYKPGDVGMITSIFKSEEDNATKARIHWPRTSTSTMVLTPFLSKRFLSVYKVAKRVAKPVLVGTTTSGYVFAVDLQTGEEVWATQASQEIAGVKGVVSNKDGIVLVATDRCTDRYCYRYRNQTNPLAPGNRVVRALSAADGTALWEFKPASPVWNFMPQYHEKDGTFFFSDFEGTAYSLKLATGKQVWATEGAMGTYTLAAAIYYPILNQVFALGLDPYKDESCNPYPAPGILPRCGTWPGSTGWIRALNATSGKFQWEVPTTQPPASAAVGYLNGPPGQTRLVVSLGHNCFYRSKTLLWALDPQDGAIRWMRDGPTLWSDQCAGDKAGGDIRRAMGGRATCDPGSWSTPVIDKKGDVYIGNQVGELQRWGNEAPQEGAKGTKLLATLSTGVAFQDNAIAFGPGFMAVSTCASLMVFASSEGSPEMQSVNKTPIWNKTKLTNAYYRKHLQDYVL